MTEEEKLDCDKIIQYHKDHKDIGNSRSLFDILQKSPSFLIGQLVDMKLIRYTNQFLGRTILTDEGRNYTTFSDYERDQSERAAQELKFNQLNNEKLLYDLDNAKKLKKWFVPVSLASIAGVALAVGSLIVQRNDKSEVDNLDQRINALEARKTVIDTVYVVQQSQQIPDTITNK
jgi:hypothetical protein